ncbi:MAG: class I SAM-dependent methyltransferase [Azoarcus sp.]|nr:class I SAM-dependent methyltransferase [Azoarcus sp.]
MPEWLKTPLGQYLIAWEQARLDTLLANIFGYNALQIGLAETDLLRSNRMPLHLCAGEVPARNAAAPPTSLIDVPCNPAALPFASASLDLAVLAHVLEFSDTPHQLLREAERVLVADGNIIVCGFNPYSLWGRRRKQEAWPWNGKYYSAAKVRDWLTVLGFEVQSCQYGGYVPAVESSEWLARWKWLDRVGRRCWPICGAAWILHGIKRVHGMRLIQPKWREKCARAKNLAPVARKLSGNKKTGETWKP